MRAVRVHEFGEPEVMNVEAVEDPRPGPGQVLIRVRAVGVNPVETYIRAGAYGKLPTLPYTPGTDLSGIIEALGECVGDLSVGEAVYTFGSVTGAYAELAVCDRGHVYPLPPGASFAAGAALGVAGATAWRALFQKGGALPGEHLLVHGASGGVGSTVVQLARAAGLRVVGTAGTDHGLARVRALGAHLALDHRADGYLDAGLAFTGGRGFDLIFELLANVNLARDMTVLAPRGRIVVVGSRGLIEIDPRQLMTRDASVTGMSLFNATAADLRQVHAGLYAALEAGALKPSIGREYALDDVAEAHREVMRPGSGGKIILLP